MTQNTKIVREPNKIGMKSLKLVLLFCALGALKLAAQEDVKTKKISIFTDGNSFVEKTFKLTPNKGKFTLKGDLVPKARFGTLLVQDKDNSIETIKSFVDTIRTPNLISSVKTASYQDILKANLNKLVTVITKERIRTGEVTEIVYRDSSYPTHVLFKERSHYDLIRISDIINLSFPTKPIIPVAERKEKYPRYKEEEKDVKLNLLLEFEDSDPKEVSLKYLQKGVSWTPFYYLELDDEKSIANFILKGEVINDSEEIKDSALDLFIGEPNFAYSSYLTDLVDFKHLLDPSYDAPPSTNVRAIRATGLLNEASAYSPNQNKSPKNYHDFYVYTLENESLPMNSRAHYTLFEQELKYKHVYQCDLLNINHQRNTQQKKDNKVYHSLKYVNNTGNLLGEGPVTIIDNSEAEYVPLAQSKLEYTPSKATGLIKITETPEIEILQKEEVINVEKDRIEFWGYSYKKVRINVVVKVNNYKDENIDLILRQEVFGEVEGNSSFIIVDRKEKYYLPNAINQLEWNLQLKPGEKKEVTYQYEYLRR